MTEQLISQTTAARHWAYYLPPPAPEAGWWGHEAISEHAHPEYWAMIWGYSADQVVAAKAAACEAKLSRLAGAP